MGRPPVRFVTKLQPVERDPHDGAERAVGVYYTLDPRVDVPVGTLPPGTYKVRVDVATDRTDLPPKSALPAPPVRDSVEVVIR